MYLLSLMAVFVEGHELFRTYLRNLSQSNHGGSSILWLGSATASSPSASRNLNSSATLNVDLELLPSVGSKVCKLSPSVGNIIHYVIVGVIRHLLANSCYTWLQLLVEQEAFHVLWRQRWKWKSCGGENWESTSFPFLLEDLPTTQRP